MKCLRYKIGARLLRPWLIAEMHHWNKLASVYVTRDKVSYAIARRDAVVAYINGSSRRGPSTPENVRVAQ